jgi:hypothetical protein
MRKHYIIYPIPGADVAPVTDILMKRRDAHRPIQIMLRARDGRWYLQEPSKRALLRRYWRIKVFFGKDAPDMTAYEIAVIDGRNTVKVPVLDSLEGLPVLERASYQLRAS